MYLYVEISANKIVPYSTPVGVGVQFLSCFPELHSGLFKLKPFGLD
jgi:hypothetical protein